MNKRLLANLIGLMSGLAVFSGTVVFSASRIETVPIARTVLQEELLQELEPGIADLLAESGLLSDSVSSEPTVSSKPPVSSEPTVSSKPPVSSEPTVSSKPPVSSEPAVSSKPPVSSEPAVSSKPPVSSEPTESDEPSAPEDAEDEELLRILAGAVQREIIGVGTRPLAARYEAYKAQAVASHSYMEYFRQSTGSYPQMSYTTPHADTVELVREVMYELMYYNGTVIHASYHAASGGYTQGASYVWGGYLPYLVGVESDYDDAAAKYTISESSCRSKLVAAGISVTDDPYSWFDMDSITYTDGNFVETINICGKTVTGRALREQILGSANLKSCKIVDIVFDGNSFTFSTLGYGHGVGLSQQGAIGYAEHEGWDYRQILEHYYSGVTIE